MIYKASLLFLTLAFAMIGPRFGAVDFTVVFLFITSLFSCALWIKRGERIRLYWFEALSLYLLFYSFALFVAADVSKPSEYGHYFFRILRAINFYMLLHLLHFYFKVTLKHLIYSIIAVLLCNLFVSFAQAFNFLGLRGFFVGINTLVARDLNIYEYDNVVMTGARARGLLKGFDVNSIFISALLFFALFSKVQNYIKVIALFATLVGTFISARTGIVAVFIILIMFTMEQFFLTTWKKAVALLLVILAVIVLLYSTMPFLLNKTSADRVEELFASLSLRRADQTKVASFEDMVENHLTVKNISSPSIWLLGQATKQHTENGENRLTSDVGYIQLLFNFGIFNLFIIVSAHLYLLFEAYKKKNPYWRIYTYAMVLFLVLAIKGPYFFSRSIYDLIVLMFFHHSLFLRSDNVCQQDSSK